MVGRVLPRGVLASDMGVGVHLLSDMVQGVLDVTYGLC